MHHGLHVKLSSTDLHFLSSIMTPMDITFALPSRLMAQVENALLSLCYISSPTDISRITEPPLKTHNLTKRHHGAL